MGGSPMRTPVRGVLCRPQRIRAGRYATGYGTCPLGGLRTARSRQRSEPHLTSAMRSSYIACIAAITLAACGYESTPSPVAGTDAPVKIGHLVSGDRISYRHGAAVAVEEINGRGGLLGRPVELVSEVGIEEAAVAAQTAEKMIVTDEVVALIGPNRSAHAIEVGPVAQRRGVPMITTAATNPIVTAAGDLVFMAAYTDRFQGRVMAQFASETLGVTTAAFLTQRGDVYAEGIAEFFATSFRGFGGTIVAEEFYESGATDLSAELARIAAVGPDVLFLPGLPPEVALITGAARAFPLGDADGEPTVFLGADTWDNPALLGNEEAAVDGSYFSTHFSPDTDEPGARAFVDRYRALYGAAPSGGDGVNYDAVRLFVEAVERAGTLDADAVRQQLAVTEDYAGATRIARYDEDRHPTKSAVIMSIRDGAKTFFRQVNP